MYYFIYNKWLHHVFKVYQKHFCSQFDPIYREDKWDGDWMRKKFIREGEKGKNERKMLRQ